SCHDRSRQRPPSHFIDPAHISPGFVLLFVYLHLLGALFFLFQRFFLFPVLQDQIPDTCSGILLIFLVQRRQLLCRRCLKFFSDLRNGFLLFFHSCCSFGYSRVILPSFPLRNSSIR